MHVYTIMVGWSVDPNASLSLTRAKTSHLKKCFQDLKSIETPEIRNLLEQISFHSLFKSTCFKHGITQLNPDIVSLEPLKFCAWKLISSERGLRLLSRLETVMQYTDLFNYVLIDFQQANFVCLWILAETTSLLISVSKNASKIRLLRKWVCFLLNSMVGNVVEKSYIYYYYYSQTN